MSASSGQTTFSPQIGDRVFCTPAGLTGEVVGIQDQLVGVRYDLGYIGWESPSDLRRAGPGETTGMKGLPPSDPFYAQQQSKIARSKAHAGFDDDVLRQAIAAQGAKFRTKDVSQQDSVLNAHPSAATSRNYNAMIGRHLNAHTQELGIALVSSASHARGALWQKVATTGGTAGTQVTADTEDSRPKVHEQPAAQEDSGRQALENQIDGYLRSVGLDPAQVVKEGNRRNIGFNSTRGLIDAYTVQDFVYLRVSAYVMRLPSDRDLILPLLRDVLELNTSLPGPARAAVAGDAVVIAAILPAEGLTDQQVAFTIFNVMSTADSLLEVLQKQYGGTTRGRGDSGQPSTAQGVRR